MPLTKEQALKKYDTYSTASVMFHMHASRPGPVLSNEIMLSIKEYERNPNLKTIIGVHHPGGIVAKYVGYWLGGMPRTVREEVCSNLQKRFEANYATFDELLCQQAEKVPYTARYFLEDCLLPVYRHFKKELDEAGVTAVEVVAVGEYDKVQNFAAVMTQCSVLLINTILRQYSLPTYEIISVHDTILRAYVGKKHIDPEVMQRHAKVAMARKQKQIQHAYDFIAKDLKAYVSTPNGAQLVKLLRRFHNNHSHTNVDLSLPDIAHFYATREYPELTLGDYIGCANRAYQTSIVSGKGEIDYISGEDMVRIMFEMAAAHSGVYMGMQEFMRDFDYSIYESLTEELPELHAQFAAFKTWDTAVFPEFDTNLVFALKYLKD